MQDYFRNLHMLDPLFHALVLERIRDLREATGQPQLSVGDLTEADELEILRNYSVKLFKEYRTLRTVFLENMTITPRSIGPRYNSN